MGEVLSASLKAVSLLFPGGGWVGRQPSWPLFGLRVPRVSADGQGILTSPKCCCLPAREGVLLTLNYSSQPDFARTWVARGGFSHEHGKDSQYLLPAPCERLGPRPTPHPRSSGRRPRSVRCRSSSAVPPSKTSPQQLVIDAESFLSMHSVHRPGFLHGQPTARPLQPVVGAFGTGAADWRRDQGKHVRHWSCDTLGQEPPQSLTDRREAPICVFLSTPPSGVVSSLARLPLPRAKTALPGPICYCAAESSRVFSSKWGIAVVSPSDFLSLPRVPCCPARVTPAPVWPHLPVFSCRLVSIGA